jgi:flavin-binding protein dodecin
MNTAIRPQAPAIAPDHIRRHHWQEWIDSAVDPGIIALNVRSLVDLEILPGGDVETPIHDLLGWQYKRYSNANRALRGWWVSGLAPTRNPQTQKNEWLEMGWGRFKPDSDTPIVDRKKSLKRGRDVSAKYLSPKGEGSSRVTFLRVPDSIWSLTAQRFGIEIGTAPNFWAWVLGNNLPIVLTEGEKKAGAILSLGIPAIALPGFRTAARTVGGKQQLQADVALFATANRAVYIAFDYETDAKLKRDIGFETEKLGRLFSRSKTDVFRLDLPGPDKGADDFIAAQGGDAFERLFYNAVPVNSHKRFSRLPFVPNHVFDRRYVGDLPIPNGAKLIGVKSPKGSGKTYMLRKMVDEAFEANRKVLLLTHRVQLGQSICNGIGLPWVTELKEFGAYQGMGLCVDSLHKDSQARFNAEDWSNALVIIDEAEQVFWHALVAQTEIKNHRPEVLTNLKTLFQSVLLSAEGQIITLDADLALAPGFVREMAGLPTLQPWIAVNQAKPQPYRVVSYDQHRPIDWYADLCSSVEAGEKIFVFTQSQKVDAVFSARNMASDLARRFPGKRILVIDSETVADPDHAAYGAVEKLPSLVLEYDIIIATPTIETGVSIDEGFKVTEAGGLRVDVASGRARNQPIYGGRINLPANAISFISIVEGQPIATEAMDADAVTVAMVTTDEFTVAEIQDLRDPAEVSGPFDKVFGCAFGVSGEAQFRQAIARVRDTVDRHIWVAKNSQIGKVGNGCVNPQSLVTPQVKVANLALKWVTAIDGEVKFHSEALTYWGKWGAALNSSLGAYRATVLESLTAEGHGIIQAVITNRDADAQRLSEIRTENNNAENLATATSDDLSGRELEKLQDKKSLNTAERRQLRKASVKAKYGGIEVTPELLEKDQKKWHPKLMLHYYLEQGRPHRDARDQRSVDKLHGNGQIFAVDLARATVAHKIQVLEHIGIRELLKTAEGEENSENYLSRHSAIVQKIVGILRAQKWDVKDLLGFTVIEDDASPTTGKLRDKSMAVIRQLINLLGIKLTYVGRFNTDDGDRDRFYQIEVPEDGRNEVFTAWLKRDEELAEMARREAAEAAAQLANDF